MSSLLIVGSSCNLSELMSPLSFKSRPKLDVENNRTECETSQELDDPQLPD